MSYQYWKDALAGKKPPMYVDQCELGFYRKSISERNDKGNSRRVGWEPVAVFMDGDVMVARVGTKEITDPDKLNDLWSWIASNAISEEWYRAVAEQGLPWPDAHDPSKNVGNVLDAGGPVQSGKVTFGPEEGRESPEQKLAREIAEAKAGVSQYAKIESDEMAGRAISLKNELTTLAGKLDKVRETLVRPHVDAQAEINGRFNPIIKDAKEQCKALLGHVGEWEDLKRDAARKAQAEADRIAREHAEKARKAEEAGKPPPPAPTPVAPNAPPPSVQIAAAVGKKASVKVAKIVTSIDLNKAFAQFGGQPEVYEVLLKLAQQAVDAGLTVDGAVIEEKSVVK